nr:reverse transcriptase domain, reverse transcriptase zinc-binding domain protein [Tanacetum cinerariifolium]
MGVMRRNEVEGRATQVAHLILVTTFPLARFQRGENEGVKNVEQKQHVWVNVSVSSSFSRSFAAAVSNDARHHKSEMLMEDKPVMVIDEDCMSDKNFKLTLVAKVETFDSTPNLRIIFKDEGFEYVTIRYLRGFWVSLEFMDIHACDSFKRHEGMDTLFSVIQPWKNDFRVDERVLWVDVKRIPSVAWTNKTFMKIAKRWGELVFTEDSDDNNLWRKWLCVVTKVEDFIMESFKVIIKGSSESDGKGDMDNNNGNVGEVKSDDPFGVYRLLNHKDKNKEGGSLVSEDPSKPLGFSKIVVKDNIVSEKEDGQVNINDSIHETFSKPLQASRQVEKEQQLECNLSSVKGGGGSVALGGFSFTWAFKDATKMSKLDRFLMSEGLLCNYPAMPGLILARHLSDHRPIILRECGYDYGPIPFKMFHSWFDIEEDLWKELRDLDASREKDLVQKAKIRFLNEEVFLVSLNKHQHYMLEEEVTDVEIKKHCGIVGFRPISLIGCQYKIVGKILANRLRSVIGSLVSKEQSAFIRGHQILDGLMILSEVIDWCNQKKRKTMIFKVDLEKAYDSVQWEFLDMILYRFGFCDTWRGWIKGCLVSSSASILVNGSPTQEWKEENLYHLVSILQRFFLASGLQINIHKCCIMGVGGVTHDEVTRGAQMIGCEATKIPFKYLGVMVGISKGVLKRLESCRRIFFRGMKHGTRKISWFSWDSVVASKEVGGLGMSIFSKNCVFLFKWIWRFKVHLEASWVSIIKAIHGPCVKLDRDIMVDKSSTWLDCIRSISYLKGKAWIYICVCKRRWRMVMILYFDERQGGAEGMQMEELTNLISSFEFVVEQDNWVWNLDGEASNKLPTRFNMILRGLEVPSIDCPVCHEGVETSDHLFFSYSVASFIMARVLGWGASKYWNFFISWLVKLVRWFEVKEGGERLLGDTMFVSWWIIWNYRNKLIFTSDVPTKASLFDLIISFGAMLKLGES